MRTVTLVEAKTQLRALVEAAQRGETIIIARHGKPAAKLTGINITNEERAQDVAARILSRKIRLGMSLAQLLGPHKGHTH